MRLRLSYKLRVNMTLFLILFSNAIEKNIRILKINKIYIRISRNFQLYSSNALTKLNNSAAAGLLSQELKASKLLINLRLSLNLLVASDGKAKLVINQSSEYKNIEIMTLDLLPENEHAT